MFTVRFFCIAFLTINYVSCNNNVCDYEDLECTTNIAKSVHKLVVDGIPGQIRSSDPLIRDEIHLDHRKIKYKLTNARMFGLRDCIVEEMRLYKSELTFKYIMLCPNIHIKAEYEINGDVDGFAVEGKGDCKISADNYKIILYGQCDGVIIDGNLHTQITDFDVEASNKGSIDVDFKNLADGNKRKSDAIYKDILHSFMKDFIVNSNDYMKMVPTEMMLRRPINTEL